MKFPKNKEVIPKQKSFKGKNTIHKQHPHDTQKDKKNRMDVNKKNKKEEERKKERKECVTHLRS